MDDREHRIRAKAHEIWRQEGFPSGQEQDHWDRAQAIIDSEDQGSQNKADPASSPTDTPVNPAAAKGKFFRTQGDLPELKGQIEIAQGANVKGDGKRNEDR